MLKFIIENKEWIFSGIGVFFLAGLCGLIRFIQNRKRAGKKNTNFREDRVPLHKP